MTILDSFNYGITERVDASRTKLDAAQELINVNLDSTILASAKNLTKTTRSIYPYFYNFKDGWVSNYNSTDYVEYENILYWTEENRPAKYYQNGCSKLLGIKAPTAAITATIESAVGLLPAATYQYRITHYNITNDTESAPSPSTADSVVTGLHNIALSGIVDSSDPQVTHNRIYRIGGALTQYKLIVELAIGTSTFTDNIAADAATIVLDTSDHVPPPEDLHSLTLVNGRMLGLNGVEILFSELDEPGTWPPFNSFKLPKNGTGMLKFPQGTLIFTRTSTHLFTGTSGTDFRLSELTTTEGCLDNKSCQLIKNLPVWVSHAGICTLQNGYVELLSRDFLGNVTLDVKQTIVHDEQYFILKTDGTILVLDMRAGFRFYNLEFDAAIDGMGEYDGKLYFASEGVLCTAFTGEDLTLKYISPVLIENNHVAVKLYNNIYIRAKGQFTIKFFVDDNLVLTDAIPTTPCTGPYTSNLTCPSQKQRGYSCYFEIEGEGKVYAIEVRPPLKETRTEIEDY